MVIGFEKLSKSIQGAHPARLIEAALLRAQSIFHAISTAGALGALVVITVY